MSEGELELIIFLCIDDNFLALLSKRESCIRKIERVYTNYLEGRAYLKQKRDCKENSNLYRGRTNTNRGRDFNKRD